MNASPTPVKAFYVVGLASSAGGPRALLALLSNLPKDFPAACVVIQHLAPNYPSHLASILGMHVQLPVAQAKDGMVLQQGKVYLAPPDKHLLMTPERTLVLSKSEKVHYVRPSADLFLESLAQVVKSQALAVILTGTGMDGASGVCAVSEVGGICIAQDQATSEFFGMPGAAINTGKIDFILPLAQIAPKLIELTRRLSE